MAVDTDMTYSEVFKIVLKGVVIQNPLRNLGDVIEPLKEVLYVLLQAFARVISQTLFPISVPLLTWLVQIERKNAAERISKQKQRIRGNYKPLRNKL